MQKKNYLFYTIITILVVIIFVIIWSQFRRLFFGTKIEISRNFFSNPDYVPQIQITSKPDFSGETSFPEKISIIDIKPFNKENWQQSLREFCDQNSYNYSVFEDIIQISANEPQYDSAEVDLDAARQAASAFITDITPKIAFSVKETSFSSLNEELNEYIDADIDEMLEEFDGEFSAEDLYEGWDNVGDEEDLATEVIINYNLAYEELPIYQRVDARDFSTLIVGTDYKVTLFEASAEIFDSDEFHNSRLITIDQALTNIQQGDFYVNAFISDVENNRVILTSTRFSTVSLEYRLNDEQTQAIPCYHFTGAATDADGQEVYVEIITPAINFTVIDD